MSRVLFLTWDGPETRYLESLFLPIFARARRAGYSFDILQLTWGPRAARQRAREQASALGMRYTSLPVPRALRPLSTGGALLAAAAYVTAYLRRHRISILLARSILPAAIASLARATAPSVALAFDADGLPADERVEFASWSPGGAYYRIYRDIEAQALRTAGAVITRTRAAREILLSRAGAGVPAERIVVVPNAKDEALFHPGSHASRLALRARYGVAPDAPWVVFAGGLGPQYHPARILEFFARLRRRRGDARLLVLTGQTAFATELVSRARVPGDSLCIQSLPADEVAPHLAAADLGIAFREPSFSQRAVSPIKVAEYLLCGLPVLATRGVGDLDEQLLDDTALLLPTLDDPALEQAVSWLVDRVLPDRETFRTCARALGERRFALAPCAERYAAALALAMRVAR